ncbi:hypothetical protein GLYMA_07G025466v4 [Glycine max]|nr:hypothetical protein GLYMA_07G025466v4 [Glycine max]KAH1085044.1 hypothetical protein GYH30_017194 [Glycine max]
MPTFFSMLDLFLNLMELSHAMFNPLIESKLLLFGTGVSSSLSSFSLRCGCDR